MSLNLAASLRAEELTKALLAEGMTPAEIARELRRRGALPAGPRGGRTPGAEPAELIGYAHSLAAGLMQSGIDAERAAVVEALRAWAEDGGDPWMAHCADRIVAGEHLTRTGAQ
jgi:hypothetical protein